MKLGSKALIRDINNNLVLETIIKNQPISRASLSKKLGLTKATISSIVQDLINQHFIIEIGNGRSSTGRKPILLQLNHTAGYSISISINNYLLSIMLTDLLGEQIKFKKITIAEINPNNIFELLTNMIDDIMIDTLKTTYGIIGITVSIDGIVNNNQIIFTPHYELANFLLAEKLEEKYNVPVHLKNKANLSILGEKIFSYDAKNMAYVNIDSSIGLGLVINDRLYEGYNGFAGEFGHTIIEIDGKPCTCGKKGCLEQYVSEQVVLNNLAKLKNQSVISFEEFLKLYRKNDKDAKKVINDFKKYISIGISNLFYTFNPEVIILNSRFTDHLPEILDEIKSSINNKFNKNNNIKHSSLKNSSPLYGGAYINIKNFLGINNFKPKLHN